MASTAAYFAKQAGEMPFILTGSVRSGLPPFSLPPTHTTVMGGNGTLVEMGFTGMVSVINEILDILSLIIIVFFSSSLPNWVLR